jgi:hypothetical protein
VRKDVRKRVLAGSELAPQQRQIRLHGLSQRQALQLHPVHCCVLLLLRVPAWRTCGHHHVCVESLQARSAGLDVQQQRDRHDGELYNVIGSK